MKSQTVNQSIPKYWNKKDKDAVKVIVLTEYLFRGKKRLSAPAILRPTRMKLTHLNQLTKIIALYGHAR